jgi:nicotinamidase-related amidase
VPPIFTRAPLNATEPSDSIIDDSPDMTVLPSIDGLRLVALDRAASAPSPAASPDRDGRYGRTAPRRPSAREARHRRPPADRARRRLAILIIRSVPAAGGKIVPRPQLAGDARLDLCRRRSHRAPYLQEGIVNVGVTADIRRLRRAAAALADLAQAFDLPVLISGVPTTGGTVAPPLAEIAQRLPHVRQYVRTTANALDDQSFRDALESNARRTIVLAGVATEVAVRLAALAARRAGCRAIVAIDACGGLDARTESATFIQLCAAGVELSSVATIAAQLGGDFGSKGGRAAMRALQSTLDTHAHHHDEIDEPS